MAKIKNKRVMRDEAQDQEFDWRKGQQEREKNDPDYDEDDLFDNDETPATQTLIDELGFDPDAKESE